MSGIDRAARVAGWVALASLGLAFLAAATFAVSTLVTRPLEYVEGEVLFDASRLRDHLGLYIDPLVGTFDYGPVPARYYVAYVPIWAWLLSHLPAGAAAPVARAIDLGAWYGLLAWIVWRAPRANRRLAGLAALFTASCFPLVFYAASARPDTIPVVLAGVALWRAVRDDGVDALGGVLFALAAWIKPNVVGMAMGALLWPLLAGRRRQMGALVGALVTSASLAILLQVVSSGAWLAHLLRSTNQPLSLAHLLGQLRAMVCLFALPLAAAVIWGARARHDPAVRVAFPALLASVGWTTFSLCKFGTTDNHWLEPSLAAVILVARATAPHPSPTRRAALIAVAALQACLTAVVTVHSSFEAARLAPSQAAVIARARRLCEAEPGDIVLSPDVGIEYMMNGRILTTPFQMTYLARRGAFPLSLWMADLESPHVRGIVMENDVLERPPDAAPSYDRLDPPLRRLLARRFVLVDEEAGLRVYQLKPAFSKLLR
jgi:hypothetical protein